MNNYYLDASALVKRYVDEAGSDWLRWLVDPVRDSTVFISQMTIIEVISAFARRIRDGSLTPGRGMHFGATAFASTRSFLLLNHLSS